MVAMELRDVDASTWHLTGYASVTGVVYDVGWYSETIERGAFKRTLGETPDVQLLINHTGMPLARTSSGTLRLQERTTPDASGRTGLWVEADLDKLDPDAQALARKMKRGDIDQMSFAFQVTTGSWNEDYTRRRITAVSMHRGDVSVVNQGANPTSTATLRAAGGELLPMPTHSQRAVERLVLLKAGRRPQGLRTHAPTGGAVLPDHSERARQILADLRRKG